jgi:putative Ca2+/H+ antiporter (TMEM165/GDT1 family)
MIKNSVAICFFLILFLVSNTSALKIRHSMLVNLNNLASNKAHNSCAPLSSMDDQQLKMNDSYDQSIDNKNQHIAGQKLLKYGIYTATAVTAIVSAPYIASASSSAMAAAAAASSTAGSGSGFVQSFLLIFLSELGDKTFFIAALLASNAKFGKFISFTGSLAALAVMTIISTILGQLFHAVPESLTKGIPYDDYIAVAAFAYFGIRTLIETSRMGSDNNNGESAMEEEKAEAEDLVQQVVAGTSNNNNSATGAKSSGNTTTNNNPAIFALLAQVFSLVFAAEIGDRSFLSTIALSAALNPYAVAGGAIAGHGLATGIAVIGGSILSKYLSEKLIGYIGGSLFLIFAVTTAFGLF